MQLLSKKLWSRIWRKTIMIEKRVITADVVTQHQRKFLLFCNLSYSIVMAVHEENTSLFLRCESFFVRIDRKSSLQRNMRFYISDSGLSISKNFRQRWIILPFITGIKERFFRNPNQQISIGLITDLTTILLSRQSLKNL